MTPHTHPPDLWHLWPKTRTLLDALRERGPLLTSELAALDGASTKAMRARMRVLAGRGLVRKIRCGRAAKWGVVLL